MKWFSIKIGEKVKDSNYLSIAQNINQEFPNIKVWEYETTIHNLNIAIASNREITPIHCLFGDLIIAGDINIHNTEELGEKYGIKNNKIISEGLLIKSLYQQKGIDFVKDLVGEFSFLLLDTKTNRYYAIRDHLGIKQLFWMRKNSEYIIVSDLFLLKEYFNMKDLNHEFFQEFLDSGGIVDIPLTPYKHIYRIPSGSYLQINRDNEKLYNYWSLSNTTGMINRKNISEYKEEFKQILSRAVTDRLIDGDCNSVMLSGGLDSTSIYALAKQNENIFKTKKVATVSAVFDELKECDERGYIEDLMNLYRDKGTYINLDEKLMYNDFPNNSPFSYEPSVNALTYEFGHILADAAVTEGRYNVLSGFGGDHLLTGSLYTTRDYLKEFKFNMMFSTLTNYSISTNSSAYKNLIHYTLRPDIVGHFIKKGNHHFRIKNQLKKIKTYNQKELFIQLSSTKAHLYLDRVTGAITGADISHPFLDKRLVEFVYQIPGDLRFRSDYQKYILRESMKHDLPSSIIKRVNKTFHLGHTYKSIRSNWNDILSTLEKPIVVNTFKFVSQQEWDVSIGKWRNGLEPSSDFWVLLSIEYWLKKFVKKINVNSLV